MTVKEFLHEINMLCSKYGLDILWLDYTDVTALC